MPPFGGSVRVYKAIMELGAYISIWLLTGRVHSNLTYSPRNLQWRMKPNYEHVYVVSDSTKAVMNKTLHDEVKLECDNITRCCRVKMFLSLLD